jgi:hypothetical protein
MNWDPPLVLNLLAPAVLLGFLRMWSFWLAHKWGVYFTSEAILIAYAYFALARAVFLYRHSHDHDGRYNKSRVQRAEQDFYRQLSDVRERLLKVLLPLLAIAALADLVTARSGVQAHRVTLCLVLGVELIVWLRVGPWFIVAAATWSRRGIDFASARELVHAHRSEVMRSFRYATATFFLVALPALALYKPLGRALMHLLPSGQLAFYYAIGFFAALAFLALRLHCRWAAHILPRLKPKDAATPHAAAA